MSTQLIGDVILFDGEREAVYDNQANVYRFYHKYKSCLPTNVNLFSVRGTNIETRQMNAEIWVPICSPSSIFSDGSLVALRGRLIMPSPTEEELEEDEEPALVVCVEVVHASLKGIVSSIYWTSALLQYHNFPETLMIGCIAEIIMGAGQSIMFLIRTSDEVDGCVEENLIA